jgi:hypothetical protein
MIARENGFKLGAFKAIVAYLAQNHFVRPWRYARMDKPPGCLRLVN